jgi:hypothetical protein
MKYTRTPTGIKCQYSGHTVTGSSYNEANRKMFVLLMGERK